MRRGTAVAVASAALAAFPAAAWAQESADERADRVWEEMSGEVRAGWRFLRGEEEGRFFQDESLQDGPRIFDFVFRGATERPDASVSEFEAEAHGVGEEDQDYRLKLGRENRWSAEGGWRRDDYSYRSTGDPFPYDTRRERADFRLRITPSERLTLRLEWDRGLRRGDAFTGQDSDINFDSPPGVEQDIVQAHRPLEQQSDRVTLGADAVLPGGFRASLAETWRLAQVEDVRTYDIPPSRRGADPVREDLRRDVRSPAWTTVAKAAWAPAGGPLDVSAIFSWTRQDAESRVTGFAQGFGAGLGPFVETTTGGNDTDRTWIDWRVESSWRPIEKWEFTGAFEQESIVDDASIRLTRRRTFEDPAFPPETTVDESDARITDRLLRASLEAEWEVRDDLRLRFGEEWLQEDLEVPTDSRTDEFVPTDFASTSWRSVVGTDWDARKNLTFSVLARIAQNDDPHAATSFESGDDISCRTRWKATDTLSLTSVYRHRRYRNDQELDSASRADSASLAASWTHGAFTATPNVTWQAVETWTDTTFFDTSRIGSQPLEDQVRYRTRDVIVSLDLRYEFAANLRAFLTGTLADSGGTYEARWDEASLGAEYDVRENLTFGAALRGWRLDEDGTDADDYTAQGVEVWLTFRF
jgi:hypothetical protein